MIEFPPEKQQSSRLQELVNGYCDGSLAAADLQELQEWIRNDEQARLFFVGYLAVDAGLKWEGRRGDLERFLLTTTQRAPSRLNRWTRRLLSPQSLIAMTLLFMAGGLIAWSVLSRSAGQVEQTAGTETGPVSPDRGVEIPVMIPIPEISNSPEQAHNIVVATLAGMNADVVVQRDGQPHAASVGMNIVANDALQVPFGGSALVKLPNAASIQLGPRSVLSFLHEGRPELTEGFAEVDDRDNSSRMAWSLRTSNADAEIRSSRFAVGTDTGHTHVRVADGSVSVLRHRDGAMLDVGKGFCSTIADNKELNSKSTRYGTALMVISPKALTGWNKFNRLVGDRLIGDRLWRFALSVKVRTLDELTEEDLLDCAVIIVSIFDEGEDEMRFLSTGIADLAVPVICLEPSGFPTLAMTGPKIDQDYSFTKSQFILDIARPEHPLAAGYQGSGLDLYVGKNRKALGWAAPVGDVQKIAHIQGQPDHWVLFAFEKGDMMFNRIAPERRVGLLLNPVGIAEETPALNFVDAAIQWCVEAEPAGESIVRY